MIRMGFRRAEKQLRNDTGAKYWPKMKFVLDMQKGLEVINPVLAKLWYFWTNHFTISDTQSVTRIFYWGLSKRIYQS